MGSKAFVDRILFCRSVSPACNLWNDLFFGDWWVSILRSSLDEDFQVGPLALGRRHYFLRDGRISEWSALAETATYRLFACNARVLGRVDDG
jgi:hypothetical protein